MTTATLMTALDQHGRALRVATFQGAERGAPLVWRATAQRLGQHPAAARHPAPRQVLLDAWKRPDLPEHFRITLMTTLPGVLVLRQELVEVARAFQGFAERHDSGSLPEQAELLLAWGEQPEVYAVGWHHDPDVSNPWVPEGQSYDFARGRFWFLFDMVGNAATPPALTSLRRPSSSPSGRS